MHLHFLNACIAKAFCSELICIVVFIAEYAVDAVLLFLIQSSFMHVISPCIHFHLFCGVCSMHLQTTTEHELCVHACIIKEVSHFEVLYPNLLHAQKQYQRIFIIVSIVIIIIITTTIIS